MLKLVNAILVVGVVASSFVLYSLEHASRKTERQIIALKKEIREEGENLKLLNAEWSYLTRPARLERLARQHLNLQLVRPEQLVSQADLGKHLIEPRSPLAADRGGDAIGDMLKGLQ